MTASAVVLPDFGTDVACADAGLAPVWGFASGSTCLANRLVRRLTTPRKGLFYDLNYGTDVRQYLNRRFTPSLVFESQQDIVAEVTKDDAVNGAMCTNTFSVASRTMTIQVLCDTDDGPFSLVLSATQVTVAVLAVNGVQLAAPAVVAGAVTSTIVAVPGPAGPAGPPGPSGAAGSAQACVSSSRDWNDDSGTEFVIDQFEVNLGALSATITLELSLEGSSVAGTGNFRVRIGGGDGTPDGTVRATVPIASPSMTETSGSTTFTNPNGLARVKITGQANAGNSLRGKGFVVTIR